MGWADSMLFSEPSGEPAGSTGASGGGARPDGPRAGAPSGPNQDAAEAASPEPEDDRLRILRLVQQGRLTPEQALKLLEALTPPPPPPPAAERAGEGAGPRPGGGVSVGFAVGAQPARGRMLRIRILEEGEDRVNLNIPLGLARSALRLIPARAQRHLAGVDLEALLDQIEHGATGKILVIQDDDESGVEVVVE